MVAQKDEITCPRLYSQLGWREMSKPGNPENTSRDVFLINMP